METLFHYERLRKNLSAIPGSIRKADNFCGWLRRLLEYCSSRLRVQQTVQESPLSFLKDIRNKVCIEVRAMRLAPERLQTLISTLQLVDLSGLGDLSEIVRMGALAGTYHSGFAILFESVDERGIPDPRIQLACLDASLVMRPIFTKEMVLTLKLIPFGDHGQN